MTIFTSTKDENQLLGALLSSDSGIVIVPSSFSLNASSLDAVNLYDGSLQPLGIGSGLLLTSGTVPGTTNTVGWFGTDNTLYDPLTGNPVNYSNGDPSIDAVVNSVFQTQSYDATTLGFSFTATPGATSISFDLVFGSDEFPEWVDQFVDCAVVIVNGVNYALFNHDPNSPLSVIGSNLANGYFQDNAGNILPIEYDGVSHVLKIVAPINPDGVNTIKIGIADTGDHIYDSGIFISNLKAGNLPGSGVVSSSTGTASDDVFTGTVQDELIDLKSGNDVAYAGGGDDIVIGGDGNDKLYAGSGYDVLEGDAGDDLIDGGAGVTDTAVYTGNSTDYTIAYDGITNAFTITSALTGEGIDTLVDVEILKFKDGLFTLGNSSPSHLSIYQDPTTAVINSPGSVVVSGIAMANKIISATPIDIDGVDKNSITYEWLSSVDGSNWVSTSVFTKNYSLTDADVGLQIKSIVTYLDGKQNSETVESTPITVAQANTNLSMALMQLASPNGSTVADPLTTLISNATALGLSANEASLMVKNVLGLPDVSLQFANPFADLTHNPLDLNALALIKAAYQVAMTVSVSDPTGYNLSLQFIDAYESQQSINLSDSQTLSNLLSGVGPSEVAIVQNLNKDMADANSFDKVKLVWLDFCGQVDALAPYKSTPEVLFNEVNVAPTGFSESILPAGQMNHAYLINEIDLLKGFSDKNYNDVLHIVSITSANGDLIVNNLDGTWTLTPLTDYTGPIELSYVVSDSNGGSAIGANLVVITNLVPQNNAPTASDVSVSTNEDTTLTGNLPTATDVDGDNVTYALGTAATNGVVTVNADGTYSYVPMANFNGIDSFTYSVSDGHGGSNTYTVSVTVDAVSDLTALADTASGNEDTTIIGSVATNDSTISGGTLSYAKATDPSHGTVTVNADGTYSYAPTVNYNGSDSFSYTVTDSASGESATRTVTLTLNAVNDAPTGGVAISDTTVANAFREGDVLTVVNTIVDADGISGAFKYQWKANGIDVVGASGTSYTLTEADIGKNFTVVATYTDNGNTLETVISSETIAVIAATNLTLTGTAGVDTLTGRSGDDTISGLAGNDILIGNAGNDNLDGGAGTDTMLGGKGNDTYVVDLATDVVTENLNEGTDTVKVAITTSKGTYTLGSNVENSLLVNTVAFNLTGNGLDNVLTGNAAANTLNGGAGNDTLDGAAGVDTLVGGTGNDTYIVDITTAGALQDTVTETTTTTTEFDTLKLRGASTNTAAATITLGANLEILDAGATGSSLLNLTGNALNNSITGNNANNVINGGAGADTMAGGLGNDTYVVDNLNDVISEILGQGTDLVQVGIATANGIYSLGANLENATLTNTVAFNILGNDLDNVLTGNAAANTLTGGLGNDSLDGGAGADTLIGGLGNDSYKVDVATDVVTENLNEGVDTVNVAITTTNGTYTLGTNVENGFLVNTIAFNLTGNALDNSLTGNAAVNTLNGGAGNDTLVALNGNDILQGGDGNDILFGGLGNDTLTGGLGNDQFKFDTALSASTNLDKVSDFTSGQDSIQLAKSIFAAVNSTGGVLDANNFAIGTAATTATQHLLYNSATGALSYDSDGSGKLAAIQFATLATGLTSLTIKNTDFIVY